MELYQAFASDLYQLLNNAHAVRITVPEYLPLSVEEIGVTPDGHPLVSLCQYGDVMPDCDLVFMISNLSDGVVGEPVSFRNDYLGIVQHVYRYDEAGRRTHVVLSLKQELKEFARAWLAILRRNALIT